MRVNQNYLSKRGSGAHDSGIPTLISSGFRLTLAWEPKDFANQVFYSSLYTSACKLGGLQKGIYVTPSTGELMSGQAFARLLNLTADVTLQDFRKVGHVLMLER